MSEETRIAAEDWDFRFRSGRPCLDLLATVGDRDGQPFDRWRTPADLGRWCREAGLVPEAPRATPARLAEARALREAVHRLLRAALAGGAAPADDLALLNAWARLPSPAPQLAGIRRPAQPAAAKPLQAALAAVARDAVALLSEGPLERVRQCAAEDCSVWFLDSSRPGRRRWCAMSGCGNREKKTSFRRRRRAGQLGRELSVSSPPTL